MVGGAAGCLAATELSGSFLLLRSAGVDIRHMTGDFLEKYLTVATAAFQVHPEGKFVVDVDKNIDINDVSVLGPWEGMPPLPPGSLELPDPCCGDAELPFALAAGDPKLPRGSAQR